ncbi:hypothetical protein CITRIK5_60009 [Citricoccus sp. K5]|nr:hypothetical protein CITRIK5_60009 [Citricoccus sp. K5]
MDRVRNVKNLWKRYMRRQLVR